MFTISETDPRSVNISDIIHPIGLKTRVLAEALNLDPNNFTEYESVYFNKCDGLFYSASVGATLTSRNAEAFVVKNAENPNESCIIARPFEEVAEAIVSLLTTVFAEQNTHILFSALLSFPKPNAIRSSLDNLNGKRKRTYVMVVDGNTTVIPLSTYFKFMESPSESVKLDVLFSM